MEKAKNIGIEAYATELNAKIAILEDLLENYNDGRRKNFFCLAVNLLELADVELIMAQLKGAVEPQAVVKEKAAAAVGLFQARADELGIELRLRKK